MRIWLVQSGEEMPSDGDDTRLLRTCLLAHELSVRGHEVTYINSTFNHQRKISRYNRTTQVDQPGGYKSVFLHGRPYRRNIGFGRILSHRDNARAFTRWASEQASPDLVHCGLPPLELAAAATSFARSRQIPSTVDCRDVWPEIISDRLPTPLRVLASPFLAHWYRQKAFIMRSATAITGVSEGFVDWGVTSAGRARRPQDHAFHLATPPTGVDAASLSRARKDWTQKLGDLPPNSLIVCYAGTFSSRFDLSTILDGADRLSNAERRNIRIVLCGNGDMREEIERRSRANPALVYGGWCNRPQLLALMECAQLGLLPYPNSRDFLITFPNKIGEYLTAGLPILTGTEGAIRSLLEPHGLWMHYSEGSPDDFAQQLRILSQRQDLPLLRARAKALAEREFDPRTIYVDFADWIETVAAPGTIGS